MKKLLSMVLALALVLTTIVVPMTVSADELPTITVEYEITAVDGKGAERIGAYYPGDEVTVAINAVSSADNTAIAGYDLIIPWTGNSATGPEIAKVFGADDSYVGAELLANNNIFLYATDQEALTFGTEAITLATLTFTVADNALNGYTIPATGTGSYVTLNNGWYDEVSVTAEDAEYTVGSHIVTLTAQSASIAETPITATSSNDSIDLKSKNEETITLTLASETGGTITNAKVYSATSQSGEYTTEVATFTEGVATVNAFGYYKVVCETQNKKDYAFYFNYKTNINADLDFVASGIGVVSGNTFTVTVSASELGENKAEVVDFTVVADEGITLTNAEVADGVTGTVENNDGVITYESGEVGVANGDPIVVLTFTANTQVIGTYGVAFNNQSLAVSQGMDGDGTALTESEDAIKMTIYKVEDVFEFAELEDKYTTEKTQDADYADGWSAKDGEASYKVVASTGAATAAEEMFAATEDATELAIPGTITYNKVDYNYYTVARFGAEGSYVYEIIQSLTAEAIMLDGEAPTIDLTTDFEDYKNYEGIGGKITFDVADDNKLADDTLYYSFESAEDVANNPAAVVDGVATITLEDTSVVYDKVYVKTTDEAGHETAKEIAIKYDNVDPEISAVAGLLTGQKVPITVTVSENEGTQSDINTAVTVLYKTEEGAEPAEKETINVTIGEGYEYMADNGFYAFKATDEAGNETTTDFIKVSTDKKAPVGISPKFAIKTGVAAENAGSLKNDEWLATAYEEANTRRVEAGKEAIAPSNGSFAYLQMFDNAAATGTVEGAGTYATEYKLVGPGGNEVADWDKTLDATTDAKGEYKLTVKVYMEDNKENDYQEETFTFSIYSNTDTEFATLNGNNTYTIADYSRLKKMVEGSANKADTEFAAVAEYFEGGFFCGDLDASLDGNYMADRAAFIEQLKTAKRAAEYQFAIYNNITPAE